MGIYNVEINLNDTFLVSQTGKSRKLLSKYSNDTIKSDVIITTTEIDGIETISNIVPIHGLNSFYFGMSSFYYDNTSFYEQMFILKRISGARNNPCVIFTSISRMILQLKSYHSLVSKLTIEEIDDFRMSVIDFIRATKLVTKVKMSTIISLLEQWDRMSKFTLTTGRTENEKLVWRNKAIPEFEKLLNLTLKEYEQ